MRCIALSAGRPGTRARSGQVRPRHTDAPEPPRAPVELPRARSGRPASVRSPSRSPRRPGSGRAAAAFDATPRPSPKECAGLVGSRCRRDVPSQPLTDPRVAAFATTSFGIHEIETRAPAPLPGPSTHTAARPPGAAPAPWPTPRVTCASADARPTDLPDSESQGRRYCAFSDTATTNKVRAELILRVADYIADQPDPAPGLGRSTCMSARARRHTRGAHGRECMPGRALVTAGRLAGRRHTPAATRRRNSPAAAPRAHYSR
jgi:hypothetical protein